MRTNCLIIALALTFALTLALPLTAPLSAQQLHVLFDPGERDKRINIVFLSEGYQAHEMGNFLSHANNMLGTILQTPPYSDYKEYFNAYAISVASNESGSSHPSQGISRDTYFQSTYESFGIDRLLTVSSTGSTRARNLLMNHVPEYDIPVLIVNDTRYGGSGGWLSVTSIHPSAPEIMVHEVGHSFATLTDEYETPWPAWTPREFRNATAHTHPDNIPWNVWIEQGVPIPTPVGAGWQNHVGLFQGAQYNSTGWYRPWQNCKMRSLGVPFCPICQEAHIEFMYTKLSPVETYYPALAAVEIEPGDIQPFTLATMEPENPLDITWLLDGLPVDGANGPEFLFDSGSTGAGQFTLTVLVTDATQRVRNPRVLPLLADTVSWTVDVQAITPVGVTERPLAARLHPNYPNPFNPATVLAFTLGEPADIVLEVFDLPGRRVATAASGSYAAGRHSVTFDATGLGSGMYFYRLTIQNGEQLVGRMILLR
jgi:hypothetical protein